MKSMFLLLLCPALSQEQLQHEFEFQTSPTKLCSLYIAPSTIPNAGLGIFTAFPLETGDRIGNHDLMIPIVDADLSIGDKTAWMIDDYTWDGSSTGLGRESRREYGVTGFGPGLDGAINCNLALLNVDRQLPEWDDAGLHRSRNPGAGAVAQYSGSKTFASSAIPAGGELFKFYGDNWFESRPETFGNIPLSSDYVRADQLLRRFYYLQSAATFSENIKRSLYDLVTSFPFQGRTVIALPKYHEIVQAIVNGIGSLKQPDAIRSIRELESTGRCLDNIQPGSSSLPEAGRGAFATRPLTAGKVITGSPFFHIPYDSMLFLYKNEWNEGENEFDVDMSVVRGYQLLLNYCWGHKASTVLLCPYSAGVNLINHNQSQANVAVRWAPNGQLSHNSTWLLETPVNEMTSEYSTKIAMDFTALRDIEAGEELFLDYGDEWEKAWIDHVHSWTQFFGKLEGIRPLYQAASTYNNENSKSAILTEDEQDIDPYPANLELRCHKQAMKFVKDETLATCINPSVLWQPAEDGLECDVLERKERGGSLVYTIRLVSNDGSIHIAKGVPRSYLAFFDRPYSTDMHLPWAFRHEIAIPDDMIPDVWKNVK